MPAFSNSVLNICANCLRAERTYHSSCAVRSSLVAIKRQYTKSTSPTQGPGQIRNDDHEPAKATQLQDEEEKKEEGAFSRRLRTMGEEAIETGGHSAKKAVEEAGFNAELKAQLEQRIAAATFRSSAADIPSSAPQHSRDLASAEAWAGTETLHDISLRMLNDSHKPMRLGRPPRPPGVQMPKSIDTGHQRSKEHRGLRLANARDRSGLYASVKDDPNLAAADREKQLQEMKERFEPGARTIVPGSIQGLTSLANQRIEDAIARGQFKNIPRGKGKNVERDHNASSPFIDTTEYFMNKIIQKQEIVPPWIEKQQELTLAASKFRGRLRADWKRHAARVISSKGGSLHDQLRRAESYALAEIATNPLLKKRDTSTSVNAQDHLSQITLSGELKLDPGLGDMATESPTIAVKRTPLHGPLDSAEDAGQGSVDHANTQTVQTSVNALIPAVPHTAFPFRDPAWERIEFGYHTAAIKDLNDKCRSYNLQAPELAKRPYFNLQRELNSCFADIAPQLAQAIFDRTRRPPQTSDSSRQNSAEKGLLDSLVGGPVRIRDERTTKQYGFKQFWRDLWSEKPETRS